MHIRATKREIMGFRIISVLEHPFTLRSKDVDTVISRDPKYNVPRVIHRNELHHAADIGCGLTPSGGTLINIKKFGPELDPDTPLPPSRNNTMLIVPMDVFLACGMLRSDLYALDMSTEHADEDPLNPHKCYTALLHFSRYCVDPAARFCD